MNLDENERWQTSQVSGHYVCNLHRDKCLSQSGSESRRLAVEYRWQREDSIFRSICLPLRRRPVYASPIQPVWANVDDWILKDLSYQSEQERRNVVSVYTSTTRVAPCFPKFTSVNLRRRPSTQRSFVRASSMPIKRPTKGPALSHFHIYSPPLPGIKADTFAWPSFALWTKEVSVVMSEFSAPRAERSQRNRYADATFYFSKRIASGFSAFTERREMSPFLPWVTLQL